MGLAARLSALLIVSAGCGWAACGDTEQDRLVWARERMHPSATKAQTELVYQWLTNGTRSCSQSGDLWYFRGIVAKKLGNASDADYAFRKATENGSKAQGDKFDPFLVVSHAAASSPSQFRDKWALIVGVGTFENSFDLLRFSVKDARDFGAFLVKNANFKEDHVKVLVDAEAKTASIREAFGDIRVKAKANDLVLVYFSSHGQARDLDPTGLSYVLTYDTDTSTQSKLYASGLQMVELAELGRWVLAQNYVLLLDTCYAGAAQAGVSGKLVPQGSDGLDPLQGLKGSGNRAVISASRADEKSFEDDESKHGYFTRFLLEALKEKQNSQSLTTIYQFLQQRLTTQHPVMQTYAEGNDIVLGAPMIAAFLPSLFDQAMRGSW